MIALLALPRVAGAIGIQIGGIDNETQYTASDGVLTFDDAFNGGNDPEPGDVTSSDVAGFVGKDVNFEIMLDTGSFNPATDNIRQANFVGTGAGPELTIWSGNTVLLALDVDFIRVTFACGVGDGAAQGCPPGSSGQDGRIILGAFDGNTYGDSSALTVVGGTLNNLVGGIGTKAVLQVELSSLNPQMTKALRKAGYLNFDFTNGNGLSQEDTTWNLTFVPEPGSALLLGVSAMSLLIMARRRARS